MLQKRTIFLPDAAATHNLGVKLGRSLAISSVVLLEGDLGTGKTTLVQGLGKGLDIPESIDSPTFTLINEYTSGRIPLYHLDLYRLQPSEVETLNLEMYWEGIEVPPGIVAIEWADRLSYKPTNFVRICLTNQSEGGRQAEINDWGVLKLEFS